MAVINPTSRIRKPALTIAGLLLCVVSSTAAARDQLYGVLEHAGLLQCENDFWSGQTSEAQACYRGLLNAGTPARIRAEALWALGDPQGANAMFQQAIEDEPENPLVRLRWGELFLDTYQNQEAYDLFAEALELDQDNAWAHMGAVEALESGNNAEALQSHLNAVNSPLAPPGVQLRTMLKNVGTALQRDDYEFAEKVLNEAFDHADEHGLSKLELHALRAAHAFMTRQPHQEHIDAALALNPAYGDAYAIPGFFANNIRRYEESVEFYEQAVQIQPNHWVAHLELGQNHLRLNHVTQAQDHVLTSYEGDPYNPRTVNILRLLETFIEDMETLSFPNPPEGPYPTLQLRLSKEEAPVIAEYARELSMDSIELYSERYNFEPTQPIVVEIFPNHDDFVVRSIGMPGVGILGVTFGYLFAMDSPTAHPRGNAYHWGTTLWHEMAHVFTLRITDHLIPRWFSEGISVFEEWRTGPIPGRKIPNDVLGAMAEGKFLPITALDDGFMRPTYDGQVIVSYMQSGLVFEFIEIEYGFDKIVDMLHRFKDGVSTQEAIEASLGISVKDFDRHFEQFIELEYGPLLSRMPMWQEDQRSSFAALEEQNWQEAIEAADRAIFIYPDYVEVDSPYIAKARAYSRLEESENEMLTLQEFWRRGGWEPRALMALAEDYLERGRDDEALEVLKDIIWADPFMNEVHLRLGDLYMEKGMPDEALHEYEVLLALDPIDKASVNLKIARAYRALGDRDKTTEHLMAALEIAPQFREAQMLLLELSRETPTPD